MVANRLVIVDNCFTKDGQVIETENVLDVLHNHFNGNWPQTARIFHDDINEACDVTPKDAASVKYLSTLKGDFYVLVYPGEPITIFTAVAAVAAVASVAYVYLTTPKISAPVVDIPSAVLPNRRQQSPNNELSARVNSERINSRIPDIYGKVRSTPDLLAVPYKIFEDNEEVEYAYMCVGRGDYVIGAVYDDNTKVTDIAGSGYAVYGPYTSPNSGSPTYTGGEAISEVLWESARSNAVNGQVLQPPNNAWIKSDNVIKYTYPNTITAVSPPTSINFLTQFEVGEDIEITMEDYTDGVTVNLTGTYEIAAIASSTSMTLVSPASVNADWNDLNGMTGNSIVETHHSTIESVRDNWVGPFVVATGTNPKIYNNFVAVNGLYKDGVDGIIAENVQLTIGATPIDDNGDPTGSEETFTFTVNGSSDVARPSIGQTSKSATLVEDSRYRVRVKRTTATDINFEGTVIDEIRWRDLYGMTPVTLTDFGNVTTVHSVTQATNGALAVKNRKLNLFATRKINLYNSAGSITGFSSSTAAIQIMINVCLDTYIGRRATTDIDFSSFFNVNSELNRYFGTEDTRTFNYTFDNDGLSFEESLALIAKAIFCIAYRQGSLIKLHFEKAVDESTLLFNHRNKIPKSERRSVSFGYQDDYDGVEVTYIDPRDFSTRTLSVPEDVTLLNPQKIETFGVVHYLQAYVTAWRAWNKIRYQRVAVQFQATREADILVINDRILVEDNTRSGAQDGEVVAQDGNVLTLSQDISFDTGVDYVIYLQNIIGSVEAIPVRPHTGANKGVLNYASAYGLSVDAANYARSTYTIVGSDDSQSRAYLVEEKTVNEDLTVNLSATNYDSRYYTNDTYYKDNLIEDLDETLGGLIIIEI